MICTPCEWQLQCEQSAWSQAVHVPGRYQIHLWKQVNCADPLGDVQIGPGRMLGSESSPRHFSLTCWLLGFQGVSPALQFRAEPGTTRACSICAMAVEGLAAWQNVWFSFDNYSREPWGLRTVQYEGFWRNYKACLWVSLHIQGKYSMLWPSNNTSSRAYVPRLSLIQKSRKGLFYSSNYSVFWACSCSALYSA